MTSHSGPPTQQQVADFARSDRPMTSKLVTTLAAEGYLERAPDPVDARSRRLELTPRGLTAVRAGIAAALVVDQELFGPDPALRGALQAIAEQLA